HEPFDGVVDVAEAARLLAVAVDGERVAAQRLDDEVAHHPAVTRRQARAVAVEQAHDADRQVALAVVGERHRLGAALAFVVARARPDRIDVAVVRLGLRTHPRVAVDLPSRRLPQYRATMTGQPAPAAHTHSPGPRRHR